MAEKQYLEIERYLDRLRYAVERRVTPAVDSDPVEEIRSHLEARVAAAIGDGHSESEAVSIAINEMGNPESLGAELRELRIPDGRGADGVVRRLAAGGVTVLLAWFLLEVRSWDWGFHFASLGFAFFVMPFIWGLWPTVIWRRNSLAYAGLSLGVVIFVGLWYGSSFEQTIEMPEAMGGPLPEPTWLEENGRALTFTLASTAVSILALSLMSRSRQRWACLGVAAATLLVAEIPHQWEEWNFEAEKREIVAVVETYRAQHERYPSADEFQALWEKTIGRRTPRLRYQQSRDDAASFSLWSARALKPSCGVVYHSGIGWMGHD
ncbi:MAG: permease prefix domain 1-containing protein [Planctomycetota bacterium]